MILWVPLAVAMVAYAAGSAMNRRRGSRRRWNSRGTGHGSRGSRRAWSGWRTAAFTGGVAVAAMSVSPPMVEWAHHDLRGHTVQHLALGMFAPLGLVLGAPVTLLLRTLPVRMARWVTAVLRQRPIRVVSHPATALALDVGALYVLFLTPLYAATLVTSWAHALVQFHFLAAGCLFVRSIAGPDPTPHRPSFRMRLTVLAIAIAAHSTLAKIMYAYGWPRGTGHGIEDIRAASELMYYGGDAAEVLLAVALFATRYRRRSLP